jgi:hypothetical protein
VRQAPDPSWHYIVVSLAAMPPDIRSFRILDGLVSDETLNFDA